MASEGNGTLHKLSDAKLTVKDPAEDIRGKKVLDVAGEDIGSIDDLLVDDRDFKVHFLQVQCCGFLGDKQLLIPIDAVTKITEDTVYIEKTREHVAGSPSYDPELIAIPEYCGVLCEYYNYKRNWPAAYVYPPTYPG